MLGLSASRHLVYSWRLDRLIKRPLQCLDVPRLTRSELGPAPAVNWPDPVAENPEEVPT